MDVEGVEGESLSDNRDSSIEPPRRRDSSDPVNLSLNSGTSVTSDSSHDIIHRLDINRVIKSHNYYDDYLNKTVLFHELRTVKSMQRDEIEYTQDGLIVSGLKSRYSRGENLLRRPKRGRGSWRRD